VLDPKLTSRERNRLATLAAKGTANPNYLHQVWALSEAHKLTPPGPPDIWDRYREPRRGPKLPES
jgi:hypothetical protein